MIDSCRHLLAATLGLLAASGPAFTQPMDKLVRIGWLGNTEGGTPQARAIREALPAKALGLTFPQSLLLRADEVIQ